MAGLGSCDIPSNNKILFPGQDDLPVETSSRSFTFGFSSSELVHPFGRGSLNNSLKSTAAIQKEPDNFDEILHAKAKFLDEYLESTAPKNRLILMFLEEFLTLLLLVTQAYFVNTK